MKEKSGLEQFASKNRDSFDEIKKSWAEGTSPMKESIAQHGAEMAKAAEEWKEEKAHEMQQRKSEIRDKAENAWNQMMVKLKDIELPSNPRGDQEVQPEESDDSDQEAANTNFNLEKKQGNVQANSTVI